MIVTIHRLPRLKVRIMKKKLILVVEDEAPIRRGIADALKISGYDVVEAADGESGLREGRAAGIDMVLLDLMLPKMDGMSVLRELRKTHPALPVIILTARGNEEDKVRGLRGGADDFVVKPFSAREMLARVEAVLRRSPGRPEAVPGLKGPTGIVDFQRREMVATQGERRSLSEMEANILSYLAAHRDRAVSRDELLSSVWGISGPSMETRAIDMHITRLRNKLSGGAGGEDWIETVRGKGYKLAAEVTRAEQS